MLRKHNLEIINGVVRNGKYRYLVVAFLILNLLLIYQLFSDKNILRSNHFKLSSLMNGTPEPWKITELNPSGEESKTSSSEHNETEVTRPITKPYIPTDLSYYPELGPPNTKALLSIKDYDFNGPFVGWPLERVCKETKQIPGLIFECDNNSGGIGNIRNFILTCIRYAIEAGASGLIMPQIQRRSEKELSNIFTTGFQPFHYFFDEQHFKYAMSKFCPQIVVYDEFADIPNKEHLRKAKNFYPKHLNKDFDGCDERGLNRHLDKFRPKFDEWLIKTNRTVTVNSPLSIRLKWATFFEWPIYRDGPEFANTFGDILRIRSDIQQLAAATIKELSISMGLKPNPSAIEASFLGAHLRTESDALSFWPKFDQQSDGYLAQAQLWNLSHIYLASGNATDSKRFATRAKDMLNITVTSKNDLLKDKELAALQKLSWDQQGLVDFLVLQKSTFFSGCSFSSFAMNIAVKRHSMTEGIHTRQWKNPGDKYSWLVGPFESWYGDWMFMFECLWP
ncbi:putative alternative oxidase [Golovinomyces cichoracearum]|uniref:Putative alternative oxidase n=1 Tax=Golovinomyces cichoracearum TaxID=62708 RepID=A0A420J9Z5_9PEZI|nr:putative alternative oxidase [Golovinomyces cichoracearum]